MGEVSVTLWQKPPFIFRLKLELYCASLKRYKKIIITLRNLIISILTIIKIRYKMIIVLVISIHSQINLFTSWG